MFWAQLNPPSPQQLKGSTRSSALGGHRGISRRARARPSSEPAGTKNQPGTGWHSHVERAPGLTPLLTLTLCLYKRLVPSRLFAKARGAGTAARSWPLINQKANTGTTSAAWELLRCPDRSSRLLCAPHTSVSLLGNVLSWWKGLGCCCFQFSCSL